MKSNHIILIVMLSLFLMALKPQLLAHTDVTIYDANDMIDDPNLALIVIDVRSYQNEYCDDGHIPGAYNHPWNGIEVAGWQELPLDANILVVCRSGGRSNAAATFLDSKFFLHVYDMLYGMNAWKWETVGCIDSDGDSINNDLDNCLDDYNPSQADADNDGKGNSCDSDCPDFDAFSTVNFGDFTFFAENWQKNAPDLTGDFDSNDTVNIDDLLIFAQYWLNLCSED